MKYSLILLIFFLNLIQPIYVSGNSPKVTDCLPVNYTEGEYEFTYFWEAPFDAEGLAELPIEQVVWLGYGYRQEFGKTHGFKGINIHNTIPIRDVYFGEVWEVDGRIVDRLNITYYPPTKQFILSVFEHGNYHIPASPKGGICMWWVNAEDIEMIMKDKVK